MNPQYLSLIHTVLKLLGAALAAHGATKAAAVVNGEDVTGLVMAVVGIWLSWKANTPAAIVQKAAESIPANSVIVGTSDAAPKAPAQVVSPEDATTIIRKSDVTPIVPIKDDSK